MHTQAYVNTTNQWTITKTKRTKAEGGTKGSVGGVKERISKYH